MAQDLTSKDREPVDLVLWRAGRREPGAVEKAFDLNHGLAAKPPILEPRVQISMPPAQSAAQRVVKSVKLWD